MGDRVPDAPDDGPPIEASGRSGTTRLQGPPKFGLAGSGRLGRAGHLAGFRPTTFSAEA
jgi:hypothetical protein